MKRVWTKESAKAWISQVNMGREKFGLKYCSACDFLGINVNTSRSSK